MTKDNGETREQKFVRLAQKRVSKALNNIRLIGNLSSYPHSHEHTAKIVSTLKKAVEEIEYQFAGEKGKHDAGFSFDSEE